MNIVSEGNPVRARLDKIQGDISKTREEIASVKRMQHPIEEARAALSGAFKSYLENRPVSESYRAFLYPDGDKSLRPELGTGDFIYLVGADALADLVAARLEGDGVVGPSLPAAERKAKLRTLGDQLESLERAEEIEILALEAAGHVILRRVDARPDLLLSLWDTATPQPAAIAKGQP